ncbi:DinB family protein [Saccharibacillus alkalitolerans]|uniref:Damage-inducible protein DinB n=1 Tax=Saccharibacillus alkalitolerans TaxID=2705290 RepID=A0ABX0F7K7_9BACL|nr:DinB family protein [Saccharibacillus alkalitolerans]NGZ76942.1 damage-inducible protein DinB [Saccharibacillus alkalitolerans]
MDTIRKMFNHLDWANRAILGALQSGEADGRALRLFAHTLHAERVWLTRLRGQDSSGLPIWSDRDLAFCAELMERNAEEFEAFLADDIAADPQRVVAYSDSKGNPFETSAGDILTHIVLHGQYHRGQINSCLRESGLEPVGVDYILFVR